jgi:putative transposase
MSRGVSPSMKWVYGVQRVTQVWGRSRATLYRHRRCDEPRPRCRRGPLGAMPDEALVEAIRKLLAASPFHGEATARSGRGCASPVARRMACRQSNRRIRHYRQRVRPALAAARDGPKRRSATIQRVRSC